MTERTANDRAVEQNSRLERVLRASNDGFWEYCNADGRTRRSDRWWTMLGYEPGELPDTPTLGEELIHPEDRERSRAIFVGAMRGGQADVELTFRLRHKAGHFVPVLTRAAIARGPDGDVEFITGLNTDLTDRRKYEDDLIAAQTRLEATLDAIPDLLFELDLSGRYIDFHSPRTDLLAAPLQDLIGRTVRDSLPPEAAQTTMAALAEANVAGHASGHRLCLDLPQGRRWFELSVSRKPGGEPEDAHFIVLSRDITERQKDIDALAESEGRFRTLADSAPALIWLSEEGEGCTYFNKVWLEFTGRSLTQELGSGWVDNVHPDDIGPCLDTYRSSFEQHKEFRLEYRLRRADGVYRWITDTGVPRYSDDGRLLGYVGTAFDVTERREALEALRVSEERFSLVLRGTEDAIWDIDLRTGARFLSPRWWSMLGFDAPEPDVAETEAWERKAHPDDLAAVHTSLTAAFAAGETTFDARVRLRHRAGHYVPVHVRGFVQRAADGTAIRVTGANRDLTESMRQERALRRSADLLRRMGALAGVGGWELDLGSNELVWSDEVYRIHEVEPATSVSMDWALSFFPEEARAELVAAVAVCGETGCGWDLELPMVTASGRHVWVRAQGSAVYERGAVTGLVGAMQDITSSRLAADALRASQAGLQAVIDASPIPLAVNDDHGNVLLLNPAFIATFGYTTADIPTLDKWWGLAYPDPDYRNHVAMSWAEALERAKRTQGPFAPVELTIRCKDGNVRVASVTATPLETAHRTGTHLVLLHDITEQRRVTQALIDFKFAFDQHAIVDISDADGRITYANDKVCAISKFSRDELVGQTHRIMNSGLHSKEFMANLWNTVSKGQVWHGEIKNRAKDGSIFWVDSTIVPILATDKKPAQYIAIRTDITDRERTQRALLRAQRMESIGTLAGGVAHDLNNALAPILLVTDKLRSDYPGESEVIDLVEASARRGAGMVRQLLTFAKGVEGERVAVRPAALLDEVERIVSATFPKNIQMQVVRPPKLPPIMGDLTQLHQVLVNLCVNARDAMPLGGTLTVRAEVQAIPAAEGGRPAVPRPGPHLVISVSDTGAGMHPDELERIFEPFFTTKGPEQGTGLGLSTAMGIVNSHHGFIQVESTPTAGSTFLVFLPASEPLEEPAAPPGVLEVAPIGRGLSILVVDDEPVVRRAIRAVLRPLGFEVLEADDGDTALATLSGRTVDALLTDFHMPRMNALELLRKVREFAPAIRVICASGHVGDQEVRELRQLGVPWILNKPFTQRSLLDVLMSVFPADPP